MVYLDNKRGWIRIVEAFVAVLIVSGVVLIIIGNQGVKRDDGSQQVHDMEISILRKIQLNDSLRAEILGTSGVVKWDDVNMPAQTKIKIQAEIPSELDCVAQICEPADLCFLNEEHEGNVFAESVVINSDLQTFNPRMLKLFCWNK